MNHTEVYFVGTKAMETFKQEEYKLTYFFET